MIRIPKRFAFAVIGLLAACSQTSQPLSLQPVDYAQLNGWSDESPEAMIPMLRAQCAHLARLPPATRLGGDPSIVHTGTTPSDWSGACAAIAAVQPGRAAARQLIETWFAPYEVEADARYTGYFEPEVRGALTRGGVYQTPVYAKPRSLVRTHATDGRVVVGQWVNGQFAPFPTRAQIDAGALDGQGLELVWLASPIDLFFLQIQGAGRVVLPDGSTLRLAYDGRNGQPYVPLGRVLVDENQLPPDQVSMQTIRDWLTAHPDQARTEMERNPNYVFFRRLDDVGPTEGAPGAFGIDLTPGRSLAVDRSVMPLGLPVWVETTLPTQGGMGGAWHHLTLAQDLGTDINGAGRADLYTGWGPQAQAVAGNLHAGGRMVLLLPRRAEVAHTAAATDASAQDQ